LSRQKKKTQAELEVIDACRRLVAAHKAGALSAHQLPEDNAPAFRRNDTESQLVYFTLPMSLNYRRNSDQLWAATRRSYANAATRDIFSIEASAKLSFEALAEKLLKYKMAMQPTRHTKNWHMIAQTVYTNWGSLAGLLKAVDYDFLKLRKVVQGSLKAGFPYLAGPKLFNYWCYILVTKCGVPLKNREYIDIAVDTHVAQSSVALGVITQEETTKLTREAIAERWRRLLLGTELAPVDLNVPLWFWSRDGFTYQP
jgi:hypothetical protein